MPPVGPSATAPFRGTLVLPVVELPDGATITDFRPCPGEYGPGETVGCPNGTEPVFVWRAISLCEAGPNPHFFTTTVRCPDGSEATTESRVDLAIPGDCDGNYLLDADEIAHTVEAIFEDRLAAQCLNDLDLNGFVTGSELTVVVSFWEAQMATGLRCGSLPTPMPTT